MTLIALAALGVGCGDGNNDNIFLNGCGDGIIEGNEQCDGANLDGEACSSRGFTSGTLDCTSNCRFDTSRCTGGDGLTPTPQLTSTPGASSAGETPTAGGETATPTGGAPIPTATPTGGPTCQQGSMITITVAVAYDQTSFPDVSGGTTTVKYPAGLDVPGNQSGTDQSRGANLTGTSGGFFNISDQDSNSDNVDDQVVVGLVGTQAFPPGNFASIAFDCAAGTQIPTSGTFTCTADLSTTSGTTVSGATCSVASITGP